MVILKIKPIQRVRFSVSAKNPCIAVWFLKSYGTELYSEREITRYRRIPLSVIPPITNDIKLVERYDF